MLADRGLLRDRLAVASAIDVTWTLCSLAVSDLFVVERGWSDDRCQAWLTDALGYELFGDSS
jgi:hypothetical protein